MGLEAGIWDLRLGSRSRRWDFGAPRLGFWALRLGFQLRYELGHNNDLVFSLGFNGFELGDVEIFLIRENKSSALSGPLPQKKKQLQKRIAFKQIRLDRCYFERRSIFYQGSVAPHSSCIEPLSWKRMCEPLPSVSRGILHQRPCRVIRAFCFSAFDHLHATHAAIYVRICPILLKRPLPLIP